MPYVEIEEHDVFCTQCGVQCVVEVDEDETVANPTHCPFCGAKLA